MAKCSGPLFSVDARGTVGKALTYQKSRSINWVGCTYFHHLPKSPAQTVVIDIFKEASNHWNSLQLNIKPLWVQYAALINPAWTGFNAYIFQYNLSVKLFLPPPVYPPT